MQRILLLVLLGLSASSICKGQNWRPFRSTHAHGYRVGGGVWQTRVHTLSVTEGRSFAPGDTLWYYNQTLAPWDSCGQYSFKQSAFGPFGHSIRLNAGGLTFYLSDSLGRPDSLVLRTGVAPGFAYSSGSYRVGYTGKSLEYTPSGQQDSIRAYTANGLSIAWSKNYGLLEMPALTKSGEVADLYFDRANFYTQILIDKIYGPRIPDAADYYKYAPGDTLGMYYQSFSATGPRFWSRTVIRERSVDMVAGILSYPCTVWNKAQYPGIPGWQNATYGAPSEDTLRFDLKKPYVSGFRDSTLPEMGFLTLGMLPTDSIIEMQFTTGYRKEGWCYSPVIDGMTIYTLTRGRGITFYNNGWGTGVQDCFSRLGTPCGRLITRNRNSLEEGVRLAENPVATQLEVLSPTPLHLILQDLQGRTVAEGWDTRTLDVRMLPPGLYQLRAQDKQGRSQMLRVAKD